MTSPRVAGARGRVMTAVTLGATVFAAAGLCDRGLRAGSRNAASLDGVRCVAALTDATRADLPASCEGALPWVQAAARARAGDVAGAMDSLIREGPRVGGFTRSVSRVAASDLRGVRGPWTPEPNGLAEWYGAAALHAASAGRSGEARDLCTRAAITRAAGWPDQWWMACADAFGVDDVASPGTPPAAGAVVSAIGHKSQPGWDQPQPVGDGWRLARVTRGPRSRADAGLPVRTVFEWLDANAARWTQTCDAGNLVVNGALQVPGPGDARWIAGWMDSGDEFTTFTGARRVAATTGPPDTRVAMQSPPTPPGGRDVVSVSRPVDVREGQQLAWVVSVGAGTSGRPHVFAIWRDKVGRPVSNDYLLQGLVKGPASYSGVVEVPAGVARLNVGVHNLASSGVVRWEEVVVLVLAPPDAGADGCTAVREGTP